MRYHNPRLLVVVLVLLALAVTTAYASFVFVTDATVTGSAYTLTSFDGTTLLGVNKQGSFSATFDENTVFRIAQLDKYLPVDPCREFAVAYNLAGITGDTASLVGAISGLASLGVCNARIVVNNQLPVDPCRSFRPIP
jgi:hypothetical protein